MKVIEQILIKLFDVFLKTGTRVNTHTVEMTKSIFCGSNCICGPQFNTVLSI